MKQDRVLKTINIQLDNVLEQHLKVIDALVELSKQDETIKPYIDISDYIYETIVKVNEQLKVIK